MQGSSRVMTLRSKFANLGQCENKLMSKILKLMLVYRQVTTGSYPDQYFTIQNHIMHCHLIQPLLNLDMTCEIPHLLLQY